MPTKRMLIDATHTEETRVVVVNGNRLEEFDVEAESRKQLKGNIYLAKVTRVEPSLQAAFVEYGGNRHGFLAFSEIHPDYYQIPVADREALMAEEADAVDGEDEDSGESAEENVETLGGTDEEEVAPRRPAPMHRRYKIQEVIKRRQILLIQVVKEERGNKGAALTTYISLAGRYCVLMPNTARGGGISRKISSGADRKRLKSIVSELPVPEGMAIIVRTAGSERSKAEIRRDCDYLLRLWDQIRETTLASTAPFLVHEEASLVRRAIRDLYDSSIEEVVVEGDGGYRLAKDFMKLLIPSHAKKVQPYKDDQIPLFHRYQVETQLDAMHSPTVQLRSGGYIVINPTEALVSIDVNSGRSTRERNIEETALKTNLEAAEEIARQLRLRDLAGLIVIDFIDMEVHRNQGAVERKLKDSMRSDRARIQIGRISAFGLLELSRQRLRPSLIETSSSPCPHCNGTGLLRSVESSALTVLRAIEEEGIRHRASAIAVYVTTEVALYILNQKRAALAEVETRYGFSVMLKADDSLIAPAHRIERLRSRKVGEDEAGAAPPEEEVQAETVSESSEEQNGRRRRRRRGRRGRGDGDETLAEARDEENRGDESDEADEAEADAVADADAEVDADADAEVDADAVGAEGDQQAGDEDAPRKRRRRGRRGGRRRRRPEAEVLAEGADGQSTEAGDVEEGAVEEAPFIDGAAFEGAATEGDGGLDAVTADSVPVVVEIPIVEAESAEPVSEAGPEAEAEEKPKRRRRTSTRRKKTDAEPVSDADLSASADASGETAGETADTAAEKPKRRRAPRRKKAEDKPAAEAAAVAEPMAVEVLNDVAVAETSSVETARVEAPQVEVFDAPAEPVMDAPAEKLDVVVNDNLPKPETPKKGWWRRIVD